MNRLYFLITLPHDGIMDSLNVCIGGTSTQSYSLDGSLLLVKTTPTLIARKVKEKRRLKKIFPTGKTISITYEEARALVNTPKWYSFDFQE